MLHEAHIPFFRQATLLELVFLPIPQSQRHIRVQSGPLNTQLIQSLLSYILGMGIQSHCLPGSLSTGERWSWPYHIRRSGRVPWNG